MWTLRHDIDLYQEPIKNKRVPTCFLWALYSINFSSLTERMLNNKSKHNINFSFVNCYIKLMSLNLTSILCINLSSTLVRVFIDEFIAVNKALTGL